MALTITQNKVTVYGDQKVIYATVAFGANYTTGGDEVTVDLFGGVLTELTDAIIASPRSLSVARMPVWDRVNKKILLFLFDGTELPNGTVTGAVDDLYVVFVGK